jgi:hypothetical protein
MLSTNVIITIPTFHFDTNSHDNPVTINMPFRNVYGLLSNIYQESLIEVSLNTADTNDHYIDSIWSKSYEYMSVEQFHTRVLASRESNIIEFQISLSGHYLEIERSVYTFYDTLSQIGGVMGILLPFGALLSGVFSNKMYAMTLLGLLYHVEKDNNTDQSHEHKSTKMKIFGRTMTRTIVPESVSYLMLRIA